MNQVVLMYHDVYKSDPAESGFRRERDYPYKVSLEVFERQVKSIHDYCQKNNLPKDSVVFTFDDGGCSFFRLIPDILEKYGYVGHFYVTTKYIDTNGFMTSDEIKALELRGHIVGSHAHTHEHLYKLTPDQVKDEWSQSVSILSKILSRPVIEASIPNGDTSDIVLHYCQESGLKEIYSSRPTTKLSKYKDMQLHGRYVVLCDTTDEYLLSIIGSSFTRQRITMKWAVIYCVKKILGERYVQLKNIIYRNK